MEGEGKGRTEMKLLLLLRPSLVLLALALLPVLRLAPLLPWLQLPVVAEGLEPEVEPIAGRFGL